MMVTPSKLVMVLLLPKKISVMAMLNSSFENVGRNGIWCLLFRIFFNRSIASWGVNTLCTNLLSNDLKKMRLFGILSVHLTNPIYLCVLIQSTIWGSKNGNFHNIRKSRQIRFNILPTV